MRRIVLKLALNIRPVRIVAAAVRVRGEEVAELTRPDFAVQHLVDVTTAEVSSVSIAEPVDQLIVNPAALTRRVAMALAVPERRDRIVAGRRGRWRLAAGPGGGDDGPVGLSRRFELPVVIGGARADDISDALSDARRRRCESVMPARTVCEAITSLALRTAAVIRVRWSERVAGSQ